MELKKPTEHLEISEKIAADICNFSFEQQTQIVARILEIVHSNMQGSVNATETMLDYQRQNMAIITKYLVK